MINEFIKNLSNLAGWRTDRKIVVIESDDWGSIRMPSLKAKETLQKQGVVLDKGDSARYNTFDTLASAEDLEALYNTLSKFKDTNGNHPVFTAVSLTSNPDFEKIKAANFEHYVHEPFTTTLKKYHRESAKKLWEQGIQNKLFVPQFHGREHLNVASWMRALQSKDKETMLAFQQGCWGFNRTNTNFNFQAAFDLEQPNDWQLQEVIIFDGLHIFKELHGYNASFFVPPNGPFNAKLERKLWEQGIRFISTPKIHAEPQGNQKVKKKFFWLGKKNQFKQVYLTRNAFFEPTSQRTGFTINDCMTHLNNAFKWKKPAIISTHRVNYIGGNVLENRIEGNRMLAELLNNIIKTWPDVEFMTSHQLGELINQ